MDVRLTGEQRQLRTAAEKLATELAPTSITDLGDEQRTAKLERTVSEAGWRRLRSDGASGVEVAIVAEEFGHGLIDVPFVGPALADDLQRHVHDNLSAATILDQNGVAPDARGIDRGLGVDGESVFAVSLIGATDCVDITRRSAAPTGERQQLGHLTDDQHEAARALALVATSADIVGVARGALEIAADYAKIRQQYGKAIGSYQAVAHMLSESLALLAGATSLLWYAAWAVDELAPGEALHAARRAKIYSARAGRTVCENAIQVHGGIGNTWDCLAHVYLRRVLVSSNTWPVTIKEITIGLP